MSHFLRMNFDGDPNLGLYGFATDAYCLIGKERKKIKSKIRDILKVPVHSCTMLDTELLGIFSAGNSNGIIIPDILEDYEIDAIKKIIDVLILKSKYTALGNLILMNDKGIILSPLIKKEKDTIEKFFKLPCAISTIAGINIVGKLGIATNNGCLVHPKIREKEKKILEKILCVDVDIGTVSFGSPYPGSGLLANSYGFIVSETTSGPELGRINEVLGFLQKR